MVDKAFVKEAVKKQNMTLIDIRSREELSEGMIPTAHSIPLGELHAALQLEPTQFEKRYGFPLPKKTDELIFYCQMGGRANRGASVASGLGYEKVHVYKGSYNNWCQS